MNTLEKACGFPSKFICTVSMGMPGPELVRKKLLPGKDDICGADCKESHNVSGISSLILYNDARYTLPFVFRKRY